MEGILKILNPSEQPVTSSDELSSNIKNSTAKDWENIDYNASFLIPGCGYKFTCRHLTNERIIATLASIFI